MPVTRFLTPDDSKNPLFYLKEEEQSIKPRPLLNSDQVRQDGRQCNELRSVAIQTGVVCNVTSSAYVELGSTKVLCSIQGPRQMQRGENFSLEGIVSCQLKCAPFSCKFKKPVQQEEKFMSSIISEALTAAIRTETFPRLEVVVNLIVLENDGSILTAAILCASVAMATSGIQMKDLPTACTVSCDQNLENFYCDPTMNEEYIREQKEIGVSGHTTVVFFPSLRELGGVHQVGVAEPESNSQLMDVCIEGSLRFHERLREFLNNLMKSKIN